MSIEKITSKIMDDATAQANVVMDQAKSSSDEIAEEAAKKADAILEDAKKRGQDEKEKLISRRKAVADIDGRKIILVAKQDLIGECFDKAIEEIASLDEEKYIAFLAETIKKAGYTSGEIIMNKEDALKVGSKLVERLQGDLSGSDFKLSEETQEMKGGFVLKNGAVYINGTIEALVDEAKEELISQVAKELFG